MRKHKLTEVTHVSVRKKQSVSALMQKFASSGVMGAGRLGTACKIAERMIADKQCTVFMGVAGPMIPGGMRRVLIDMIRRGWIDVLVTTGATLTHDLVEALGHAHYVGHPGMDDAELCKKGYDRVYESLMPNKAYEQIEDFITSLLDTLVPGEYSFVDIVRLLGKHVKKPSLLRACYQHNVLLCCPALQDSGIGLMIQGYFASGKGKGVVINPFKGMDDIIKKGWSVKKAGVLYIGGGVPKNYIQQTMQFAPSAASYGVQITTDRPEAGGSSGAELREGISWGKMNARGNFVDVFCDATIALPLLYGYLFDLLS